MSCWGPLAEDESMFNGFPFKSYNKSDKLHKVADWTATLDKRRGPDTSKTAFVSQDDSFSRVDRQDSMLRKNAARSTRPLLRKQTQPQASGQSYSSNNRWVEKGKPRESSIKVANNWKVIQELEFSRMADLQFTPSDPKDLDFCGRLRYFDLSMNKVSVKAECNLKKATKDVPNPPSSSDSYLLSLRLDKRTILCTDTVLVPLMCATRSVFSWDMVITKNKNRLVFDKRDGGPLDFETVNENAAEPPMDEKDKEASINSREALAFEATAVNKGWCEQAVVGTSVLEFGGKKLPINEDISRAYRYRKFELDDIELLVRCSVHCAIEVPQGTVSDLNITSSDHPVSQTALANLYALNEFDYRSQGAGGAFEWRKKLESQKGAVLATEFKNNSCKLSRWTMQSILAGVDYMKFGFVSRVTPRDRKRHQILSTSTFEPNDFVDRIGLDEGNCWGIVKAIADLLFEFDDGKYVLVRHPVRASLIIYKVNV